MSADEYVKQRKAEIAAEFGEPRAFVVAGTFSEARVYATRQQLPRDWRYVSHHQSASLQIFAAAAGVVHFAGSWRSRPNLHDVEERLRFLIRTHRRLWSVVGRDFPKLAASSGATL